MNSLGAVGQHGGKLYVWIGDGWFCPETQSVEPSVDPAILRLGYAPSIPEPGQNGVVKDVESRYWYRPDGYDGSYWVHFGGSRVIATRLWVDLVLIVDEVIWEGSVTDANGPENNVYQLTEPPIYSIVRDSDGDYWVRLDNGWYLVEYGYPVAWEDVKGSVPVHEA